jgi:hypothetical protein
MVESSAKTINDKLVNELHLAIKFAAPGAVFGGKNSSEKNFEPELILSLMRSMRHL